MVEPYPCDIPSNGKRLPFRKPDGSEGETVHAGNLMCPDHMATNPTYRNRYDQINWNKPDTPSEEPRKETL